MGFTPQKSIKETLYDIDTTDGREFVKAFEREFSSYRGKTKTIFQEYQGFTVKNELFEKEIFLLERGAIVFRENEYGYRVVPEIYSDLTMKFKALRQLEDRRKWSKENAV